MIQNHPGGQAKSTAILLIFVTTLFVINVSCELLDPKNELSEGNLIGSVLTSDNAEGISNALIRIFDADTLAAEMLTNEDGEFRFQSLKPGKKSVQLLLPKGFQYLDDPEIAVDIDGEVNIDFIAEAIREITKTITPGGLDTLATSSGSFIEVDATESDEPVDVTIEEIEQFDDESIFNSKPIRISIRQEGQPKSVNIAPGFNTNNNLSGIKLSVKIWKYFRGADTERETFAYNVSSDANPVYLYADAEKTTYKDPGTGEETTVSLHSFQYSGVDVDLVMQSAIRDLNDECGSNKYDGLRELKPINESQDGNKALIFVHGWQPEKFKCEQFEEFDPETEIFEDLISNLANKPEIQSNYDFYIYKYPTNSHILAASEDLYSKIQEQQLEKPVVIGHSMGGLVGRGLISAYGRETLTGLITLGTPHRGSPLADKSWLLSTANSIGSEALCNIAPFSCSLITIGIGIFPTTDGLKDLSTNSEFIQRLIDLEVENDNIFTIGGIINPETYDAGRIYKLGVSLLSGGGFDSDGIVPTYSSIPEWSILQTTLPNHDHSLISTSLAVSDQIMPILSALSECGSPPLIVDENDFNLSGSVGRENNSIVRITLNAISIDDNIVTDLSEENFKVIENNCVKKIQDFSTENVGVDIVFTQDLSGSMGNAISGVRSSVISFAGDLADRGINAQFASVGYSGNGNIPSVPASSPCEFIGPSRDFTNATNFQSHVANEWVASGGCDLPENGLEAIKYAHENLLWRSGAARVYINITDISHHTLSTNCNGEGQCTNQSLESITELVGETSTIHVVAPDNSSRRTASGGLDPWRLAEATGGVKLTLPENGIVDLKDLGIADVVGEAITFTFESASPQQAIHSLRIRAEINDKIAELAPNLLQYKPINNQLSQVN